MKTCQNPLIPEITKTYKKRNYNLSDLDLPQGVYRKCVWCLGSLPSNRRRWCSDECVDTASAWANPQKEYGLGILLIRQNFKCNTCAFDWGSVIEELYRQPRMPYGLSEVKNIWREKFSYYISRKLKMVMADTDPDHRPEVDHILAISKGGQALGFDNHQVFCTLCHRSKTKIDNSGPRKKKIDKTAPIGDTEEDETKEKL